MTKEEFRTYLSIAMRLGKLQASECTIDFIASCVEGIQEHKGDLTIQEIIKIDVEVQERHNPTPPIKGGENG